MRTGSAQPRAVLAAVSLACVAGNGIADGPYSTTLFTDIPGAVFFDIDNNSSSVPLGPFTWSVGTSTVTVTSSQNTNPGGGPDFYGFFNYPAHWQLARNETTDPGNFHGYLKSVSPFGGRFTILDFDTPLTGFGASFVLARQGTSTPPDKPDTIYAYDGPNATGNLIATATTEGPPATAFKVKLDFVGVYVDGPAIIRSVLIAGGPLIDDYMEIRITGLALAITETSPPCPSDVNGDTESDVLDLLDFLDSFGTCDGQPAPCAGSSGIEADFNGDALVDVLDFLDFLDAFGTGC